MTIWTALVPIKLGDDAKSRLAPVLGRDQRVALAEDMARHVIATLGQCPMIGQIVILSPVRPAYWQGAWAQDAGQGLNEELSAWRVGHPDLPLLVIHADLPLLDRQSVAQLLAMADISGAAIAPDRAGQGTNALALMPGMGVEFQFGEGSCARHCAQYPGMAMVDAPGLSHDVDTPDDLYNQS